MEGRAMKTRLLLSLVLAMLSVNAQASGTDKPTEQYLCVADQSAGFRYEKTAKEWESARFKTDSKFIIAPSKDHKAAFQITKVGGSSPVGACTESYDEVGNLDCDMLFGTFKFNKNNGRFINVSPWGYVEVG